VYSRIRPYNILWSMPQNAVLEQHGKTLSDPSCVPIVVPTLYVVVKFRFGSKNKRTMSVNVHIITWGKDLVKFEIGEE
ncbi:MAG: hypothetical protein WBW48_02270, partial [Anaerolineae bacterium]